MISDFKKKNEVVQDDPEVFSINSPEEVTINFRQEMENQHEIFMKEDATSKE